MRFTSNQGIAESEIVKFESLIGFTLPEDYREFLRRCNGGAISDGYLELSVDVVGIVYPQYLFGIGMRSRPLDLSFWYQEMSAELPPKNLLIGKDPGGAFLLLTCDNEQRGLYLYDHGYRYPTSSDTQNTYFIATGFGSLLTKINGFISN